MCKGASNVDDAMNRIELGFEHVCGFGVKLLRKRSESPCNPGENIVAKKRFESYPEWRHLPNIHLF